jgi:hypothetical protein
MNYNDKGPGKIEMGLAMLLAILILALFFGLGMVVKSI